MRQPKRLRRIHSAMKGFGYPLQYSVFVCDLDRMEKVAMIERVGSVIDHRQDSVAIVDLGDPELRGVECLEFLGKRRPLPEDKVRIV
jgi:CRISPR-associated protein Cas2